MGYLITDLDVQNAYDYWTIMHSRIRNASNPQLAERREREAYLSYINIKALRDEQRQHILTTDPQP